MLWHSKDESNRMEDRASIEEGTGLIDQYATPKPSHSSQKISGVFWLPLFSGLIIGFLIASGVFLSVRGEHEGLNAAAERACDTSKSTLASEINGLVPEMQYYQKQFWNDSSFVPTYDIVNGRLTYNDTMGIIGPSWNALFPEQKGFISVLDPSRYTLPPSAEQDMYGEYWSISAFHQVHCLQMIMMSWLQFSFDVEQGPSEEHILHCFDYIRMGLMCAGDSALEGSDPFLTARELNGTQGLGSTHVCKDWTALKGWADNATRLQ